MQEINAIPVPETGGRGRLRLGAALDLPHVAAIRRDLLDGLAVGDLTIALDAVTECDLAGLQLLRAACRQATASGRRCALEAPSPAVLTAADALGIDLRNLQEQP